MSRVDELRRADLIGPYLELIHPDTAADIIRVADALPALLDVAEAAAWFVEVEGQPLTRIKAHADLVAALAALKGGPEARRAGGEE